MATLGVLASVIAIVQAGDRLVELIEKTGPLFRASKEVDELRDEVLDLTGLLKDLGACLRELHVSASLSPEQTGGLQRLLEKAEKAITALDEIVKTVKNPDDAQNSVNRMAWMKKVSKVKRLREHLHHIRLSMLGCLQGLQIMTQVEMKRAINEVIATGGRQLSEQSANQQLIARNFEHHATLLSRILDQQVSNMQPPTMPLPIAETAMTSSDVVSDFPESIFASSQLNTFADIRRRIVTLRGCSLQCRCRCHQPFTVRTPAFLTSVLGFARISYLGKKTFGQLCDKTGCAQNTKYVAQVYYSFPKWLLLQVLLVSATWTHPSGPELLVRTLRVRPYNTPVFLAIQQGDVKGFKRILSTGEASIYDVDPEHSSLLESALTSKNMIIVEICRNLGADPYQEDLNQYTAFMRAWEMIISLREDLQMRLKLEYLFPTNDLADYFNFSPLHSAVVSRTNTSLEDLIFIHREIIEQFDATGKTALHWAALLGDSDNISILLAAGADPNATDRYSHTPLSFAFEGGNIRGVSALLKSPRTNVNARNINGATLLNNFCHEKSDDFDNWGGFLYEGARDISKYSNKLIAALFYTLVDRGFDIHSTAFFGQSALYAAIATKAYTLLVLLLDNGVDHTTSDYANQTILHIVAKRGDLKTIRILRSYSLKGLDITQKAHADQLTPIDMAEARNDVDQEWTRAFGEMLVSIEENNGSSSGLARLEEFEDEDGGGEDGGEETFEDAVEH